MKFFKHIVSAAAIAALLASYGCTMGSMSSKGGDRSSVSRYNGKVDRDVARSYEKALSAMRSGQSPAAEAQLLALTRSNPELSGPHANLGILYLRQDKLEEAEAALKKAVEINPENAEAYNYLGLVYRNQGKFGLAEQAYNKALQAAPDFSAARLNLGILNDLYLHDYQAALKNYQEYLRLNPTDEKRVSIWIAELTQRIPATADTGKEVQ